LGNHLVPPNYLVTLPFLIQTTMLNAKKSRIRHLAKAVTWRIIASGTTFLLAWFFFQDDAKAVQKATSVAVAESVLKTALYYFHERAWFRYGKLGRS
tara:strand:- start:241 stop:531 length:291 start_codon:yes stop_codon:yes gene_type:complete